MILSNLRQLIKEPTRPTLERSSCLDLFITNCDNICKVGVCNINISDHIPILLTRKKVKTMKKKCDFIGRSYRNYNKVLFQQMVIESDWHTFDNSLTVSEKWSCLQNIIRNCIDDMCPLKHFKIKQEKEPWLSNQLIELIKDKDLALRIAKKNKDPALWNEAKRLRNNCTKRLRDARAEYIKENLDNNTGNQNKFWKNIQNVIPSTKSKKKGNIKLIDQDSNLDISEENTASYINDFFVNIGPNLAKNCNQPWNFDGTPCDATLPNFETDLDEVVKLCQKININKSSCIDNLSSEIIRDAFLAVPDKVTRLQNFLIYRFDFLKSHWTGNWLK